MMRDEGGIMTTVTMMGLPPVAMLAAERRNNPDDDCYE
jgi:hypothetical protein